MPAAAAKTLSLLEAKEILAIKKEDVTLESIRDLFACHLGEDGPKYNTYDYITLPPGACFNDQSIKTTIGRYLVNLVAIPDSYLKKHGYYNDTMTKGGLKKLEAKMGDMVINDEMTTKEFSDWLDKAEWLGMGTSYFLIPSIDYDFNNPIPEVIEKRDELFEKYKDKINSGDTAVISKIEKELVGMAKDIIKKKGNESYDFYDCGIGDFGNHYKKTSIMNGAIVDPYTGKINVVKSNLVNGLKPEETTAFAALTVQGGMSRGVDSQLSGYERKKLDNALQCVETDVVNSDCGTPYYIEIIIPESQKNLFLYRYVVTNDIRNPVLITKSNLDSFVGKPIKLRSPLMCKSEKICNKCAGELFNKIGITTAGLLNDSMAGAFLNLGMKKFHDASVSFTNIDPEKYIKKH